MSSPQARVMIALGCVTGGALLLEVTLIRLLSVALWYPVAYVVLATAMLGFGASAACVALSPRLRTVGADVALPGAALAFGVSTLAGYPAWNALPVDPMSLARDASQLLWLPLLLVLVTAPFFAAGFFVARLFAEHAAAAARLYAADLVGAAAGVLAYVLLLPSLGGPGTLFIAGALGVLAALLLDDGALSRRFALVVALAAITSSAPVIERWVPLRITDNKPLGSEEARALPRRQRWTLTSAIDVIKNDDGALIFIDGGTAQTFAPRLRGPKVEAPRDLRAVPYVIGPGRSTLVVGSGGGVEVQAALGAGSERVLAIEIDPAVNELVLGPLAQITGGLFARPGVELQTAEARTWLAAHDERFDAIVAFHTISNAASATGAMSLAENYLLTVEAMELLLDRLTGDGVLVMSRPEAQLGRLCATLARAFPGDARRHAVVVTQNRTAPDFLAALVVRKTPIDAQALSAIRALDIGRIAYAPDGSGDTQAFFEAALRGGDGGAALERELPYRPATLQPATDDRPFFNMHRAWHELSLADVRRVFGSGAAARARLEDLPVAQVSILVLLLEALALAGLFVVAPALRLRRAGVERATRWRTGAYFAALGYGFITVEIVLIQNLTRSLGDPGWSLVTVLAGLLLASGAGSFWLAGRAAWSPRRATSGAAAAAVVVAVFAPIVVDFSAAMPFPGRVAIACLMVAPIGLLLGVPFAAGLSRLRRDDLVAWAWALNSLFSVAGSVLALVLGSSVGFQATAASAAVVYALAAWAAREPSASAVH